jgi:SMI1/KNR4 family protein SUKH-1
MRDEDALINALKHAVSGHQTSHEEAAPPLSEDELREAERRLGFPLPPLLRRVYAEVSAEPLGLMPLIAEARMGNADLWDDETVVGWYRGLRDNPSDEVDFAEDIAAGQEPMLEWPEKLLMISDWGCNIYSCVDCSRPEQPVIRNDNNISWSTFALEAPSLREWLERMLDGDPLFYLDWDAAEKVRFPARTP